jgi:hypothetical protein
MGAKQKHQAGRGTAAIKTRSYEADIIQTSAPRRLPTQSGSSGSDSTFRIDRGQRQDRILGFGGEYSSKMG